MPDAGSAKKSIEATERMVKQTGGPGMKMARPNMSTKPAARKPAARGNSKRGR